MSAELASVNQELSRLRQSEFDKVQDFESQKSILGSQLDNLKEDIEKANAAAQFHQEDLRRQAGIAQEAQQNYERELVKHADAARGLQQLRIEYTDLKSQIHGVKTEAETAKAVLSVNESSWSTRRENYEKELKDVRARCDDLTKQNKILLGQFESVSDQIAALQRARAEQDEAASAPLEGQTLDKSMDDLRELVLYLKQEKEIVDAQYELSKLEAKRLKQLYDHASNQLSEVRAQFNAEQQRQADQIRGATEHKELMEKISELNLLRESNSTLRFDSERKGKKVTELSTKVEELEARIQPLEQLVRELEAEKEVKDAQMKLLCEDKERWKARTQQILQKYDRVDPAELEELKQKAATVETERDESQKELEVLQHKLQTAGSEKDTQLQEQASQWRGKILKMRDEANGKISNMRTKLTQEIDSLRLQLDEASKQKEQIVSGDSEVLQRVQQEKERLEAAIKALEERVITSEAQASTHRSEAQQLYKELVDLALKIC
jgi:nucleoprotein TPR